MKDDFIYDERTIDAEIEALENEQYDLGEGFETDEMILVYAKVGWFIMNVQGLQSKRFRSENGYAKHARMNLVS